MADVTYHGKTCDATWGGVSIDTVLGWSITAESSTAESTSRHATNKGRTRLAGTKRATATVTARANGDFTPAAGASNTLILERLDGTTQYSGTATCTGASRTVTKDDVDAVEYSFEFNGTVTDT